MLINFVGATNDANHYTKPPPAITDMMACAWRMSGWFDSCSAVRNGEHWLPHYTTAPNSEWREKSSRLSLAGNHINIIIGFIASAKEVMFYPACASMHVCLLLGTSRLPVDRIFMKILPEMYRFGQGSPH